MRLTPPETLEAEGLVAVHHDMGAALEGLGARIERSDSRIGAWWPYDRNGVGYVMWAHASIVTLYAVMKDSELHETYRARALAIAARDQQWAMAAESAYRIGGQLGLAQYIEAFREDVHEQHEQRRPTPSG